MKLIYFILFFLNEAKKIFSNNFPRPATSYVTSPLFFNNRYTAQQLLLNQTNPSITSIKPPDNNFQLSYRKLFEGSVKTSPVAVGHLNNGNYQQKIPINTKIFHSFLTGLTAPPGNLTAPGRSNSLQTVPQVVPENPLLVNLKPKVGNFPDLNI